MTWAKWPHRFLTAAAWFMVVVLLFDRFYCTAQTRTLFHTLELLGVALLVASGAQSRLVRVGEGEAE